jgi:Tfp pilus assembly protein PilF
MHRMDFLKSNNKQLPISEEEKEWIEDNFEWLINNVGILPLADYEVINYNHELFNLTTPEEITTYLCEILDLDESFISISVYDDLSNDEIISSEVELDPDSNEETEYEGDEFVFIEITIAKSIIDDKKLLTSSLAYQLSRIKLSILNLEYETGPDTGVFIYLAATYFGFGLFISNSILKDQKGWITENEIPSEVLGYSLAYYSYLKNDQSGWIDEIKEEIKPFFETSLEYIQANPPEIFTQDFVSTLIRASRIQEQAFKLYDEGEYEKAVETYRVLEELDPDNPAVFNNSGFFKLRLNLFEESIENFNRALELEPEFAFAYDNKGFALIMLDRLEEGYQNINQSILIEEGNSYAYRNLGIYYTRKQDFESAYQCFEKSLELDPTTELIHFFYGMAKLENGDYNEGLEELELSATLNEKESIAKLAEIKK